MSCQACKSNHATIHITEIVNGQKREIHLCDDCARQKGVTQKIQVTLSDLMSGLTDPQSARQEKEARALRCVNCGLTFQDLRTKVRLGCMNDLDVFKEWLLPFIEKVHGSTQHVGKIPRNADVSQKRESEMLKLKKDLDEAVRKEDFELAARLRDRIRALESGPEAQA